MRQTLIFFLLLFSVCSHAQVKLEDVVKPGTKLIYGVKSDLGEYDFIVTVKDVKGSSFAWEMTSPKNMKGEIIHTKKAMENAYKIFSLYISETKTLDDQSLGVWLSQKMFKDLTSGASAVKVCMNDPTAEPVMMKEFMDGDLVLKVDGNGTKINDKFVKPARKVKDKWIIDPVNDDFFTYYNCATFPIIMRMHNTDFSMSLKEVKSNG